MSWAATAYVKRLKQGPIGEPLKQMEKFVLLMLAESHNEETNEARVSLQELSGNCLLTVPGLLKIRRSLIGKGLLTVEASPDAKRRHIPSTYRFTELPDRPTTRRPPTQRRLDGATQRRLVGSGAPGLVGLLNDVEQATQPGATALISSSPPSLLPDESKIKTQDTPALTEAEANRAPRLVALLAFQIDAELKAWAAEQKIPRSAVYWHLPEFKDHWRGIPEAKRRTDWPATYRNRLRDLQEQGRLHLPVLCVNQVQVPGGPSYKMQACGQEVGPEQARKPRPYCDGCLAFLQRVQARRNQPAGARA